MKIYYLASLFLFDSCLSVLEKTPEQVSPLQPHGLKLSSSPSSRQIQNQVPENWASQIGESSGIVWFPLSWHMRIDKEKGLESIVDDISSLHVRDVRLILEKQGEESQDFFVPLKTEESFRHSPVEVEISVANPSALWNLSPFFSLTEGNYNITGLHAFYEGEGETKKFEVSVRYDKMDRIEFQVQKGKITPLPRLALTTRFGDRKGSLYYRTKYEALDDDSVALDILLSKAKWNFDVIDYIAPPQEGFPVPRISLPNEASYLAPQKAGFLLEAPCSMEGFFKMVLTRDNDPFEYLVYESLNHTEECSGIVEIPLPLALRPGIWRLKSFQLIPPHFKRKYDLEHLSLPRKSTVEYFGLELWSHLGASAQKEVMFPKSMKALVPEKPLENTVFFLGRIALEEKFLDKEKKLSVLWRRSFDLPTIQKAFSSLKVWNPYGSQFIEKSRTQDSHFRTKVDIDSPTGDSKERALFMGQNGKSMIEMIGSCVLDYESKDPLFFTSGVISTKVLLRGRNFNQTNVSFSSSPLPHASFSDCLTKKFDEFILKHPASHEFKISLKFGVE